MTYIAYFSQAAEKGHNLKPSETAHAATLCVWQQQSSRWHFLSLIYETHWKFRNRFMRLDKDNIVLGEEPIYLPKLNRIYRKDGAGRSGCQCYSEQTHTWVQYNGMSKSLFWGSCKRSICSLADKSVACNCAVSFENRAIACSLVYSIPWSWCQSTDLQISPIFFFFLFFFMALAGYYKTSNEILSILIIKITHAFSQCAFLVSTVHSENLSTAVPFENCGWGVLWGYWK